jgi:hypothetical protein
LPTCAPASSPNDCTPHLNLRYSTKYPHIKPNKDGSVKYDKFNFPSILVWCACLFCALYGEIKSRFVDKKPSPISYREQVTLGTLFTFNYLPANYALLYMPYHIQVIAKNCRYIFVIFVGVFLSRVKKGEQLRLGMNKVFIGVLITTGALIFTLFKAVISIINLGIQNTQRIKI